MDAGDKGTIELHERVQVHAGATLAGPLCIGREAVVLAGAVVTRSVPAFAIVEGNPAQIIGYTTTAPAAEDIQLPKGSYSTEIRGVTLSRLNKVIDLRGNLTVGEFDRTIPFSARRYFMVFGVPNAEIRGEHAHRTCHQFLIAAHGSCSVVADDGTKRQEFLLDSPEKGLYLPPLTWGIQYKYSADAVLLVFASEYYDPDEYIRDYAEFCTLAKAERNQ